MDTENDSSYETLANHSGVVRGLLCSVDADRDDSSAPDTQSRAGLNDDDIVHYRVYCDQCDDWHYHGPQVGRREYHCTNPDSLYHRTGYFIELTPPVGKT